MLTNACKVLAKHWVSRYHSHVWCSIHTRRGFHSDLWPGLIPLLILHFELCVEVSPLHSPPTIVCEVADSVVCQVTMLSSFNSL